MENEVAQGNTLGNVAAAADVKHYVYSSVGSANKKTGIPHFDSKAVVEEHLKHLDLPLTIIRPVYFMENLVNWGARTDEGLIVPVPLERHHPPADDRRRRRRGDRGLTFAQPEKYIGKAFDIAGDELTFPEAAFAVSTGIGEPVRYVQTPWEAARAQNEDIYLMYDWFERKATASISPMSARSIPSCSTLRRGWRGAARRHSPRSGRPRRLDNAAAAGQRIVALNRNVGGFVGCH